MLVELFKIRYTRLLVVIIVMQSKLCSDSYSANGYRYVYLKFESP
jgi:hypothetical protein